MATLPPVYCPECREPLEIPAELCGQPVRCSACAHVFTPPPAGPEYFDDIPTVPRSENQRSRRRSEDATNDDRPPPRKRRKGMGLFAVLFGVFALLGCLCCGGIGVLTWQLMDPPFQPYTPPDEKFAAIFPADPRISVKPTGRATEIAASLEARREWAQESFFIYHFDLTAADKKKPVEKVMNELADGLLSTTPNAREAIPRSPRTHQGHEALSFAFEVKATNWAEQNKFLQGRVIIANGRAYVIGVNGPGHPGEAPWVEKFLDGLEPK
ncbi:MAG: hypothetical protein ACRCZF_27480 [Gemmataceae bacterium]